MEVTRNNFKETLDVVSEAVEEASFLSIDGEFTGLNHAGLNHAGTFDTPEERYHKIVQGSSDFLLIQFGLCAFSYNGKTKQYSAKPFNFYIFPKPYGRSGPDLRFTCQSSSIDFLISQGFDFNKLFKEGIPYLQPANEAQLKESVHKRHELFMSPATTPSNSTNIAAGKGPIDIPPDQREFIDNIVKKLEKFIEAGEEDHLDLPPSSAFQRKLTYQTVESKFGKDVHLESKTSEKRQRYIVVTKVSGEDQIKQMEQKRLEEALAELDAAVGFTNVVKMISQSGKLVVGHNILLDIIHVIHQFLYPLPREYEEFKSMCRCVFPRLIDTKLMANTQPFKDRIDNSALSNLLAISKIKPFQAPDIEIAEGFDNRYSTEEALHEAGYDAFITGQCFISLSNFLGHCHDAKSERLPPSSPLLEPFLNKIFMMRSLDIPYMDLSAPDLCPAREYVFHLTFPAEWKASEINMLFSPFGSVSISWLTDTSAFIALFNKSVASSVLKTLNTKGSVYSLISYKDYKSRQGQSSLNPKPEVRGHQATPENPKSRYSWTRNDQSDNKGSATKRSHSPDSTESNGSSAKKPKKLNVDAPAFTPEGTPTTTPEVTPEKEDPKWPENINSAGKKIVILKRPKLSTGKKREFMMNVDDFPPLSK